MGLLERKGKVIANTIRETLHGEIKDNVKNGANLFTDEWLNYERLANAYTHEINTHSIEYARGNAHTNDIENFWLLLKVIIKGTYVSVEPSHLSRYLDE